MGKRWLETGSWQLRKENRNENKMGEMGAAAAGLPWSRARRRLVVAVKKRERREWKRRREWELMGSAESGGE